MGRCRDKITISRSSYHNTNRAHLLVITAIPYMYFIHGKNGEPIKCVEMKPDFEDGTGYCDDFKCRLHEPKPLDSRINTIER